MHPKSSVYALLALVLLASCGGDAPSPLEGGTPGAAPNPGSSVASPLAASLPCAEGRLRIGDLIFADRALDDGLIAARDSAADWRSDARMVALRLSCPLFEPGLEWEGTFYSDSAQSYYSTDTGETEPTETDPDEVPTLETDGITFRVLYRTLIRAGFLDSAEISPVEGIIIRLNSNVIPFGPSTAPRGVAFFHIAVEERGFVQDLFVSTIDGAIYRYEL
ncbi:MAG: hypothetical protein M3R06_06495 [Chloroflexota bacterium]|nr:hypothetical protein [Chloroflexota bacterium]